MSKKRKRPKPTTKRIIETLYVVKAELERLQDPPEGKTHFYYPVYGRVDRLLRDLEANKPE